MKYLVDIDKTICWTEGDDYANSQPIQDRIDKMNKLVEEGHIVDYWTARGAETGISWETLTREQLAKWKVKFHSVGFNKPHADYYIDDLAINSNEFFK
jgi:hypothetical protein